MDISKLPRGSKFTIRGVSGLRSKLKSATRYGAKHLHPHVDDIVDVVSGYESSIKRGKFTMGQRKRAKQEILSKIRENTNRKPGFKTREDIKEILKGFSAKESRKAERIENAQNAKPSLQEIKEQKLEEQRNKELQVRKSRAEDIKKQIHASFGDNKKRDEYQTVSSRLLDEEKNRTTPSVLREKISGDINLSTVQSQQGKVGFASTFANKNSKATKPIFENKGKPGLSSNPIRDPLAGSFKKTA